MRNHNYSYSTINISPRTLEKINEETIQYNEEHPKDEPLYRLDYLDIIIEDILNGKYDDVQPDRKSVAIPIHAKSKEAHKKAQELGFTHLGGMVNKIYERK